MLRQNQGKKLVLGLTGSFGSGKTTVAKIFKSEGARIIDADRLAHQCIRPGTLAYKRICSVFGKDILKKNRAIDRRRLAAIVFNNKNLLKKLNAIVHPQVKRELENKIRLSKVKVIVVDAPLLLEAGLRQGVDKLIVVKINRKKQFERLLNKADLTKINILKRLNAQLPLAEKVRLADFVIDNSGRREETRRQVINIYRRLLWKN